MRAFLFDIKNGFLRFYKREDLFYAYLACLIILVAAFIKNMMLVAESSSFDIYVAPFVVSLGFVKYLFVFFLFVSFEYFYEIRSSFLEETLKCLPKGIARYDRGSLITCMTGAFLCWLLLALLNAGACIFLKMPDAEYILHVTVTLFVFLFGTLALAILFAWVTAGYFERLLSYLLLICLVFFSSFYFEQIITLVYDTGINGFPLQELFAFLPTGLDFMPNYQNPFPVQTYQIALIVAWLSGLFLIGSIRRHPRGIGKGTLLITGVICALCICIYAKPSSKILMNENPKGTIMEGQYYYMAENAPGRNMQNPLPAQYETTAGSFQAVRYSMEMHIGRSLENHVRIKVLPDNLECYAFTLFHGYQVSQVENADGTPLNYLQEQDYLYIFRDSLETVDELIIRYKGESSTYYSNRQGVYLPGDFPYYPMPGIRNVYDRANYTYASHFLDYDAYFEVSIKGVTDVFSNLPLSDGVYSGSCRGPIFTKGFLREFDFENVHVIYPYLNAMFLEGSLEQWISEQKDVLGDDFPKMIIFEPNVNQKNMVHEGSDYVIAPYLFDATEYPE